MFVQVRSEKKRLKSRSIPNQLLSNKSGNMRQPTNKETWNQRETNMKHERETKMATHHIYKSSLELTNIYKPCSEKCKTQFRVVPSCEMQTICFKINVSNGEFENAEQTNCYNILVSNGENEYAEHQKRLIERRQQCKRILTRLMFRPCERMHIMKFAQHVVQQNSKRKCKRLTTQNNR